MVKITERPTVAAELNNSGEPLNTILAFSPVGILTYSACGRCLYANQAAATIVGATVDRLLARNFRDLESWKKSGLSSLAQDVLATGLEKRSEYQVETTLGKKIWIDCHLRRVAFQGEYCLLLIINDITERKITENALRESERQFRLLMENSPVPMVVVDQERRITFLNGKFHETFGYALKDTTDFDVWLRLAFPDERYRKKADDVWLHNHQQTHSTRPYLAEITCKDNSVRMVEVMTSAMGSLTVIVFNDITERIRTEDALRESEYLFKQLADNINGFFMLRSRDKWIYVSPSYEEIYGRPRGELASEHADAFLQLVHEKDRNRVERAMKANTFRENASFDEEFRIVRPDGSVRWIWSRSFPVMNRKGEVDKMAGIVEDITERKTAQEAIVRVKQEWESTFDAVPDLIAIMDSALGILQINKSMAERLQIDQRDATTLSCREFCHREPDSDQACCIERVRLHGRNHAFETVNAKLGGDFLVSVAPLPEQDGRLERFLYVARDITEQKRMQRQFHKLAVTDPLTDLYNRRHFKELGLREVNRAKRYDHALSLLLVDVDHFKIINDTYGHETGDLVLKALAETGRSALREHDVFARIGGDEFAMLLPETSLQGALSLAERIMGAVTRLSFGGDSLRLSFTLSIGAAETSGQGADLEELLKNSDIALYKAKRNGRNRVEAYRRSTSPFD